MKDELARINGDLSKVVPFFSWRYQVITYGVPKKENDFELKYLTDGSTDLMSF